MQIEERKVGELIWRKDLYPRFEPNSAIIDQYSEAIEQLPPVEVNGRNEIIDGYHRWIAHKEAKEETIRVFVTPTESDKQFRWLAIERNVRHGLQLSSTEKKDLCLSLYEGKKEEKARLAQLLSVTERTIASWTSRRDKDLKEKRNRTIANMWLACHTEEEIAEATGVTQRTTGNVVGEPEENETFRKFLVLSRYQEPEWKPPLYNIWKLKEKTNPTAHFGNSEASFTDNLLYMYTEPFDIVVDPFAGGGATIDVCKRRLRRYWVSDRLPTEKRTDIRAWDITDGPPPLHKRWGNVSLLFLDPPYWKQAEGQYSKDESDLANMNLGQFYAALTGFIAACAGKMRAGTHIAMMMQPTQWKEPDKRMVDHGVDILKLLDAPVTYVMRIVCPYESQQANAQMVSWAKENKSVLILTREIIVWEVCV